MNGKTINDTSDFALYLLEEAHLATLTEEVFGNGDYIRTTYAASLDNIRRRLLVFQRY